MPHRDDLFLGWVLGFSVLACGRPAEPPSTASAPASSSSVVEVAPTPSDAPAPTAPTAPDAPSSPESSPAPEGPENVAPASEHVSEATRVIVALRGRLRACYARALANDPALTANGSLKLSTRPDGTVKVTATGFPPPLARCLEKAAEAGLSKPAATTIVIPIHVGRE